MKYNFDEIIDRSNTSCEKYDKREEVFGTNDIIPLWVADMDFRVAEPILEALHARIEHKVFGYCFQNEEYYQSIINWQKRRNNWDVKREWLMHCPGVVPGFHFAVQALTNENDKIIIMPPVYQPFFTAATDNKRILLENNLKHSNLNYFIDFDDLEEKLKEAKILMLCNPHNPVGRVWTRAELEKIGNLCVKHNTIIFSDEIHSDLIFREHKHIPIATLSPEIADLCITFFAPSKTFNVAGLATAVAVASNKKLYEAFTSGIKKMHLADGNICGATALEAAYSKGEEWLEQMLDYVFENAKFVTSFFEQNMPKIKANTPEGTFLQWLDFSALNITHDDVVDFLVKDAKVGLNDGRFFSPTVGIGFMRLNLACSRILLAKALNQILEAYKMRQF
jgi:cystathionine beta-lyase